MASQPVDSEIREGFAPSSISSNTGPDTIHLSSKKNKSLDPTEASIRARFATNRISRGSDSRAGRVEPEVSESHSMFAVMKKITRMFRCSRS